jgi:hypothetical protein
MVLEGLLRAETEFANNLRTQAPLPPPPGNPKGREYQKLIARYDRYIPSDVVRHIAMLLYELQAFGATDPEIMGRVIEAHNDRMKLVLNDPEYPKRTGITRERLQAAVFTPTAVRNARTNMFLDGQGKAVAFDQSCIQRLLVEFASRDMVIDAVELLVDLGCFMSKKGSSNATIYVSTGKLETIFAGFLASLERNICGARPAGAGSAQDQKETAP